jgi:hypothetical protein
MLDPYGQHGHLSGMANLTNAAWNKANDNWADYSQQQGDREHAMVMQQQKANHELALRRMDSQDRRERNGLLAGLLRNEQGGRTGMYSDGRGNISRF